VEAATTAIVKAALGLPRTGSATKPSFHSLAEYFHTDGNTPMAVTNLDSLPLLFGPTDKIGSDQPMVGDILKCFTMWPTGPAKTETLSDDPSNTVVRLTLNNGAWTELYFRRSVDGKAAYLYKYREEEGAGSNYTQEVPFKAAVGFMMTGCIVGQALDQPKVWQMLQ
jgi:hypothetical protein